MNFLPVAQRELGLLARRGKTYHSRLLSGVVVILVSLGMLYAGFWGLPSAASAGRNLFLALSAVGGAYVLFEGAVLTADCLSREKREGTLGLLFLTDLKGYDVVAGKLVSQVASSTALLVAALPVLSIALFLGGVTGEDLRLTLEALLNGLFFAAAVGMLISACSRKERRALSLTFLAVLGSTGLLPVLGWGYSFWLQSPNIDPFFLIGSPAGAFLYAVSSSADRPGLGYSFSEAIFWSQVLGWAFLLAASFILQTARYDQPLGQSRSRLLARCEAPANPKSRPRHSSLREGNPLIWAGDRPGARGLGIWPIFFVFAAAWAGGWVLASKQWLTLPVYAATALLLHCTLAYAVVVQACRGPAEDQRSGVLEILLTTPLGADAYLEGRLLSLKRQCLWPVLLVLALDAGLLTAGCWDVGSGGWEWLAWLAAFIVLFFRLLVDLYTLAWVGFWQGLETGNTASALRRTVFYVFIWRWLVLLGLITLVGLATGGRIFQSAGGAIIGGVAYLTLPVFSLQYLAQALSELHDNLRALALGQTADRIRKRVSLRQFFGQKEKNTRAGIRVEAA